MNATKQKIIKTFNIIMIIAVLTTTFNYVYAESVISCSYTADERNITISGNISNARCTNQVSLLVGDADNIIYINQTESTSAGDFTFNFLMPDNLPPGFYDFKIGSDSGADVYSGKIEYRGVKHKTQFIDGNINISIDKYIPTIAGDIVCNDNSTANVNIINTTDQTVIADDSFSGNGFISPVSYTLPSLLKPKSYSMTVTFTNGTKNLAVIRLKIDSSTVLVSIDGSVEPAEDVSFDVHLQSTGSNLINKSTTVSQTRSVSTTIPNIVGGGTYSLSVKGYENKAAAIETPQPSNCTYTVSGSAGKTVKIAARASNIKNFSDRTFVLEYNAEQIQPISFWGTYSEDSTETGQNGKVKIISHEQGKIAFSIADTEVPDGKTWSGVLNVFKFRFNTDYSGETTLKLR